MFTKNAAKPLSLRWLQPMLRGFARAELRVDPPNGSRTILTLNNQDQSGREGHYQFLSKPESLNDGGAAGDRLDPGRVMEFAVQKYVDTMRPAKDHALVANFDTREPIVSIRRPQVRQVSDALSVRDGLFVDSPSPGMC
jgi:hypothetical protein